MKYRIDTATARKALKVRREPYWAGIVKGGYVGYRKLPDGTGTWIARWRDKVSGQKYHALGSLPEYDAAVAAARSWFEQCEGGSSEVVNVETACKRYVADRLKEKGQATADDAEGRFKRLVFGKAFGRIALSALRAAHITDWRNKIIDIDDDGDDDPDPDAERRAKDSANRNLATLKAALNLAYRMGLVASTAQWDRVEAFKGVAKRRDRFLTPAERKKLLLAAPADLRRLLTALLLTAARPGEIAAATVGDLDASGLLTLDGKTGRRTVPISAAALKHLLDCAGDREASEPLLTRESGEAWTRYYWRDLFQVARTAAGLDDDVVPYSLRHAAITEMVVSGIDLLSVARLAGTSVQMIQANYGHLVKDGLVAKLDKVQVI